MELVETDEFPGPPKGCVGIAIVRVEQPGLGRQVLGIVEEKLAVPIGAFIAALGRIGATVQFKVQLTVPGGKCITKGRLKLIKERANTALLYSWKRRKGAHFAGYSPASRAWVHLHRRQSHKP